MLGILHYLVGEGRLVLLDQLGVLNTRQVDLRDIEIKHLKVKLFPLTVEAQFLRLVVLLEEHLEELHIQDWKGLMS